MYVRPFPGPGSAIQISTTGGEGPCWSRDGKELFYSWFDPDLRQRTYYAVQIMVGSGEVRPGLPELLFEGDYLSASPVRSYDVSPEGRFLLIKDHENEREKAQELFHALQVYGMRAGPFTDSGIRGSAAGQLPALEWVHGVPIN